MTTTTETAVPDADAEPATTACAYCGAPLADDQEWCLECGAARTLIHGAANWRVPVAIVATIVCLALIPLAVVLINLSATANGTTAVAQAPAQQPPAATSPAANAPRRFAGWPVGLGGWTVALARTRTEATADASAAKFADAGVRVGVLNSSQHPSMPAGYWYVFSGRYPDRARAQAAAATLRTEGQTSANAIRVAKPGGL
jgi:SPOR domain